MRFLAVLLAGVLCSTAVAGDSSSASDPVAYAVLTPSMTGRFVVASQVDFAEAVMPYLAIGDFTNNARTKDLQQLVARENYDPARTLADRLVDALNEGGYRASFQSIARRPAGSIQSLSWSDLPEIPAGQLFLDTDIRWICLCSDIAFMKAYPAISISWRLLGPNERLVEPARVFNYVHSPVYSGKKRKPVREGAPPPPPPPYPPVEVSEQCGFVSMKEATQDPQRVWSCFGEAYDAAVRRLVIDLATLRPPATPVSASGDSPSGTSTR